MRNKTIIRFLITMILCCLSFFFCSCAKKESSSVAPTPEATIPILQREEEIEHPSSGANPYATTNATPNFSGSVSGDISKLPKDTLENVLRENHIDPGSPYGYFVSNPIGFSYYQIDLSAVVPIYLTTDNEIVCKLQNDNKPAFLVLLDSADVPSYARYYFCPSWDIANEQVSFLLDGETPSDHERDICEKLFRTSLNTDDLSDEYILDGTVTIHKITVLFDNYPGLTCIMRYDQFEERTGYYITSWSERKTVHVEE